MKKTIALLIGAWCIVCNAQNTSPYSLRSVTVDDGKVISFIVAEMNPSVVFMLMSPNQACTGKGYGTLILSNTATNNTLNALWNRGLPVPPDWPQELADYAQDMCQWYNTIIK